MFSNLTITTLFLIITIASSQNLNLTYNGFRSSNLTLDGIAEITNNGLLMLTNHTKQKEGHAFYPYPINFKPSSSSSSKNATVSSFSTTFVFAIVSEYPTLSGHGIAFVVTPQRALPDSLPSQYLGLFNKNNNGNDTNHVFAVELDTIQSSEFMDINDNHVGIDINGLQSVQSAPAGYYVNDHDNRSLSLISGQPMQVWIDYDGLRKQITVTLAPVNLSYKPKIPVLSLFYDLASVFNETMYIGFSSATGSVFTNHYVLGWSFAINGEAQSLDVTRLPKLPRVGRKKKSKLLTIALPLVCAIVVSVIVSSFVYVVKKRRMFAEEVEDWELEYGPQRFKYKDLYIATKGFKDKELLGSGGFGKVYRGILPKSKIEVAVKKISHESRQGMREFVSEIVSMGRLRHRNIVSLLGYCRRKGELLLVYDYMPNGSLDKYLHDGPTVTLNWRQRFRVIKGVASGLFYLHEEWEQVVIHRDVKASNVLIDAELSGRLGDFGLARLYDHGTDPQTTHVVGTLGYLAPEHTRTGKATPSTDVFAFGAFLLEVACGRRPIETRIDTRGGDTRDVDLAAEETFLLVEWVYSCWVKGNIEEAKDPNLEIDSYVVDEIKLVLCLGLLCSNSNPRARPKMRQVVEYLEKDVALPDLSTLGISGHGLSFANQDGFDDFAMSYSSSMYNTTSHTSSVANSLLSGGR